MIPGIAGNPYLGIYTPKHLYLNGSDGWWLDPSDFSSLWVDQERTTHPEVPGDVVWWIDDKSGNANHFGAVSSAARGRLYRWPASAVSEGDVRNRFKHSSEMYITPTWILNQQGHVVPDTSHPLSRSRFYTKSSNINGSNSARQPNILPATDNEYYLIRVNAKQGEDVDFIGRIEFGDALLSDAAVRWYARINPATFNFYSSAGSVISYGRNDLGDGWYEFWIIVQNTDNTSKSWFPRLSASRVEETTIVYFGDISCEKIKTPAYIDNPYQRVGADVWDVTEEGQSDFWGIKFDGVSTGYASTRALTYSSNNLRVVIGQTKQKEDTVASWMLSSGLSTSPGSWSVLSNASSGRDYIARAAITSTNYDVNATAYPSPTTNLLDMTVNDHVSFSIDDTALTPVEIPAPYLAPAEQLFFGVRANLTNPYSGIIWGAILVAAEPDPDKWEIGARQWLSNHNMGGILGN